MSTEERPLPVGLRNCNPGNLRYYEGNKWKGQIGADKQGFVIFSNPADGIQALLSTLRTYIRVHKLDSIAKIVPRYAPAAENDVKAYINGVCAITSLKPDTVIDMTAQGGLLAYGIIVMECGRSPWTADFLQTMYESRYGNPAET